MFPWKQDGVLIQHIQYLNYSNISKKQFIGPDIAGLLDTLGQEAAKQRAAESFLTVQHFSLCKDDVYLDKRNSDFANLMYENGDE